MNIVYDSRTGYVEKFVNKLPKSISKIKIGEIDEVSERYILITYTDKLGAVSIETKKFLSHKDNASFMRGVSSSGNRNFGIYYGLAADKIGDRFGVPVISKFELSGSSEDVDIIVSFYEEAIKSKK